MAYTMSCTKSLIFMCAFAALANCAKADIESAQEHQGTGRIVVHDPDATIGRGDERFKWMIVSPDGSKGFSNDFMTNALSVVTEDGTNYYAHIQGENNDRTKVIHFTVNKDGIPNKDGDVIDTTLSGEPNNATRMQDRKLVGISKGYLFFCSAEAEKELFKYKPLPLGLVSGSYDGLTMHEFPLVCQDNSALYFLSKWNTNFWVCEYDGGSCVDGRSILWRRSLRNRNTAMTHVGTEFYVGDSEGNILKKDEDLYKKFPGAISGLSNNGEEVFATSESTNAFYNVTWGGYNIVNGENNQRKPMIPPTNEGLLRVIDNRKRGGKFLYVTKKGIHAIE